jgi:hypothetical protein
VETCQSIDKGFNLLISSFNPALVATLRRGVKKKWVSRDGATAQRQKKLKD